MLMVTSQWQVRDQCQMAQENHSFSSDERPLAREIAAPTSGFLKGRSTPSEFFLSHSADVFYTTEETTQGKLYYVVSLCPHCVQNSRFTSGQKMGRRQRPWGPKLPGKFLNNTSNLHGNIHHGLCP